MKPQPKKYVVRCTMPIVKEMTRYEGSKIIEQTDPQCEDIWIGDAELEAMYTTWMFVIEGYPVVGRWNSFGVGVNIWES
jgi:hypothetical protein